MGGGGGKNVLQGLFLTNEMTILDLVAYVLSICSEIYFQLFPKFALD
jgi:hypothetical protein